MTKVLIGITAIFFAVLIADSADAQTWRQFTTIDGLADNTVGPMLEDRNGSLWIATLGGLSQFDGLFTTHLSGEPVVPLLESQDGTIWAASEDDLYSYNGENWIGHDKQSGEVHYIDCSVLVESQDGVIWVRTDDGLYNYDGNEWTKQLRGMYVGTLLESQHNMIWAGTDNGLYSYDGIEWAEQEELGGMSIESLFESSDGTVWAEIYIDPFTPDSLYSYDGITWIEHKQLRDASIESIEFLLESSDGIIWAAMGDGLCSYNGMTWTEHEQLRDIAVASLMESGDVIVAWKRVQAECMLESSDGKIWAGTGDALYSYDGIEWMEHRSLRDIWIVLLLESSDGTIWAGTEDGLYSYDGIEWTEHEQLGRTGRGIIYLLEAKDGTIWAGTGYGLYSYTGATWQENSGKPLGMQIESLLESSDGTVWMGTGNGIYSYDGIEWIWYEQLYEKLSDPQIEFLLESQDGIIWVASQHDLYSYNGIEWVEHGLWETSSEHWPLVVLLESQDGTIWTGGDVLHSYDGIEWTDYHLWNVSPVSSLLESQNDTIWAGGDGLYSYNGVEWTEHDLWKDIDTFQGFEVQCLLESSDGIIWAATSVYIDEYDLSHRLYSYNGTMWTEHKQLRDHFVDCLLESSNGTIWAGGDGLYSYHGTEWIEHERLRYMSIQSLLESKDGMIWVGTDYNGVQRYDGIVLRSLTVLDGLPSNDVSSILEDRNGDLWFATDRGVGLHMRNYRPPVIEIVDPQKQLVEIGTPSVFVEWRAGDKETETPLLLYQYRIDEDAWSEPTPANFMTIPPMDDGKHTFYVRAIDGDLNYSEPAKLAIDVDTIRPNVLIANPVEDAIVGATVGILGGVTDTDLAEFQVEYAAGEEPSHDDFVLIGRSDQEVASGLLAEWHTELLSEGLYTLRLSARDELGHTKDYSVTVSLDNTPPTVKLLAPRDGSRLTKRTEILGRVCDNHLDSYILEYTVDPDPKKALWRQIFKKTELLQDQQTGSQIRHDWEVPTISGTIFIRLTVIDAAGNSEHDVISVEVPQAVAEEKGGEISSVDCSVSLHIPPRSLGRDTIVTINLAPADEIQPPPDNVRFLNLAYDIKPADLVFRSIKPATLQFKLDNTLAQNCKRIALFRWSGSEWVFQGGTVQRDKITIGITQTGRYALMEVETDTADVSEIGSLFTCQPRMFSPEAGQTTTILFSLQEETSVTLKVYNIDGRLQKTLVSGSMYAGRNAVLWDGGNEDGEIVPSGLYIITLESEEERVETKAVIVKNR